MKDVPYSGFPIRGGTCRSLTHGTHNIPSLPDLMSQAETIPQPGSCPRKLEKEILKTVNCELGKQDAM